MRIKRFIVDSKVVGTISHVRLLVSFTPNEKKTNLASNKKLYPINR